MGGLNWVNGQPNGWANVDEGEIAVAIKLALDAGVNHFDNADVYGNGRAEQMLARVLNKLGVKSESVIIATKVGHFPGTAAHAYEPAHIRHQCEQSLINLQRDFVDVYYFHHGSFGASDMYLDDAVDVMNALVAEGKVRVKGQSAYSADDFVKLVPRVQPSVLQSWAHALDDQFIRPGSVVSDLMAAHSCTFVCFSPLAQGLLLDKFDPENPPSFEEGDHRRGSEKFSRSKLLDLKPKLAQIKAQFGSTNAELVRVALQYDLAMPHVACVIPGFRYARQVEASVAAQTPLTASEIADVQRILG